MKSIASKLAILILLVWSVVVLADVFFCQESQASDQSLDPIDCCVQCCPSHNLAPQVKPLLQKHSPLLRVGSKPPQILDAYSTLVVKVIFHPPKAFA